MENEKTLNKGRGKLRLRGKGRFSGKKSSAILRTPNEVVIDETMIGSRIRVTYLGKDFLVRVVRSMVGRKVSSISEDIYRRRVGSKKRVSRRPNKKMPKAKASENVEDALLKFGEKFIEKQKDIDSEIATVIEEHLFDLL